MDLRQQVLAYYLENFDQLPADKQFHFASRVSLWLGLPEAASTLTALRGKIVPAPLSEDNMASAFQDLLALKFTNTINAAKLRAPYLEKYPQVRSLESALFRLHCLQTLYGVDGKQAFTKAYSTDKLRDLEHQLLQDDQSLRMLATYAINCLYLMHTAVLGDINAPQQHLLDLAAGFDTSDPEQLQLFIYFYTHCIICESRFYSEPIQEERLSACRAMLKLVEHQISRNFTAIHLDNKLEFLVCCRICDYKTSLEERIMQECEKSLSSEGAYLIDKHNTHGQSHRQDFAGSEHRNVLFIMSGSAFKPHRQQF